jgi:hypothetical protein
VKGKKRGDAEQGFDRFEHKRAAITARNQEVPPEECR